MKTYLVGGAVRDELLGYPVHERDWVVVGATQQQMLDLGYQQVGKDFPVFLHPESKEEYALARTERKTAPGYKGFQVHADTDVTLEDDLLRRDLTINAIARDEQGELVDPYGGMRDIEQHLLRHVSPAFAEDPVRILRVARFAARYHHLGFQVAEETMILMRQMVAQGEVDALVPERVWQEMHKALCERDPQQFIQVLRDCGALHRIMPEIDCLFGVPQPETYHPEIDTGVHTLMVLQQAVQLSDDARVRFAALLHDLGKCLTPEQHWPAHHGHEKAGMEPIKALCKRLRVPTEFRDLALLTSQYHLHVHRAFELKSSTLLKTLEQLDGLRKPQRFEQFLLACTADLRGRGGFEERQYPQADYFRGALQAIAGIDIEPLKARQLEGRAMADAIHKERLRAIETMDKQQYQ